MPVSLTDVISNLPDVHVIDIGSAFHNANLLTDYQALIDIDKVRIVGFDPDTTYADEFEKRHGGKHRIYPYALGDGTKGTFHHNSYSLTSSLYPTRHDVADMYHSLGAELMVTQKKSEIETHRLSDLSHLAGLGDTDAMYLDIQGAELDTLKHSGAILDSSVLVHTEVEFIELYQGQPLFADVDTYLRSRGFMFHTLKSVGKRCLKPIIVHGKGHEGLNQYIWADAVYVRDILTLNQLSDEKLLKFALIINEVYGSVDLCYKLLAEYDHRNKTSHSRDYLGAHRS